MVYPVKHGLLWWGQTYLYRSLLQESTVLNTTGMCAGTSPHCSQPRATRCIGLAPYHEMHEIDRFVEALTRVASADIGPQPAAVVR